VSINASDVKKLREITDAPMMDCKRALEEAGGDMEKAVTILREQGKAQAQKKAGRATSEGIARFAVSADGKKAAGIVVACETDFVSNNEDFKKEVFAMVEGFVAAGAASDTVVVDGTSVADRITNLVNLIRENIQLKKAEFYTTDGQFAVYNHHNGKLAALVELAGNASNAAEVGKQIGIQAVAMSPEFLKKEEVPQDVIDREIQINIERAIQEGKNPQMAENIAKGRVNKEYYQQNVLLEQAYYAEPKKSVATYVAEAAKEGSGNIEVLRFVRFSVGDEKAE
jgi:elongation factor Ts